MAGKMKEICETESCRVRAKQLYWKNQHTPNKHKFFKLMGKASRKCMEKKDEDEHEKDIGDVKEEVDEDEIIYHSVSEGTESEEVDPTTGSKKEEEDEDMISESANEDSDSDFDPTPLRKGFEKEDEDNGKEEKEQDEEEEEMMSESVRERNNCKDSDQIPTPWQKGRTPSIAGDQFFAKWTFVSRRRAITVGDIRRALALACNYRAKRPSFKMTMKPSHVTRRFIMTVPKSFENHLPSYSQFIQLRVPPSSQIWDVRYNHGRQQHKLGKGWADFVLANNLEVDDVCIFELAPKTADHFLDVHIFRVVENIVPLEIVENR